MKYFGLMVRHWPPIATEKKTGWLDRAAGPWARA